MVLAGAPRGTAKLQWFVVWCGFWRMHDDTLSTRCSLTRSYGYAGGSSRGSKSVPNASPCAGNGRDIRKRPVARVHPPCVRVSHARSGSQFTCRRGGWCRDISLPRLGPARQVRGARPPRGPRAGGTGSEGPGRAGLVNWQIERLTWRRGPSSHPARPPAASLLPPAAGRGLLPGRPAPATNWPTRPPLRQPGGARPALPAGPGRRAPTPHGRRAAATRRGGVPAAGTGSPAQRACRRRASRLARAGHAWSAPPVHTPSAPPRPPPQSTPQPRTAGPVGPPHYIPSDPGWARGRCAALRWPRKFSGGAGLAIQSGPPCLSRSDRDGDADRCPRRARTRRWEPAVAGASQATRGPSARGRPHTHPPTRHLHRANWWV